MRRFLTAIAFVLSLPVLAQDAPRFAIFSAEQVAQNTIRGKKIFADVEILGKSLQERLGGKIEELKKLDQQLKSPGLSDEGRARIWARAGRTDEIVPLSVNARACGGARLEEDSFAASECGPDVDGLGGPGVRTYQVVFRNNAGPCGLLANGSNGYRVPWAP